MRHPHNAASQQGDQLFVHTAVLQAALVRQWNVRVVFHEMEDLLMHFLRRIASLAAYISFRKAAYGVCGKIAGILLKFPDRNHCIYKFLVPAQVLAQIGQMP